MRAPSGCSSRRCCSRASESPQDPDSFPSSKHRAEVAISSDADSCACTPGGPAQNRPSAGASAADRAGDRASEHAVRLRGDGADRRGPAPEPNSMQSKLISAAARRSGVSLNATRAPHPWSRPSVTGSRSSAPASRPRPGSASFTRLTPFSGFPPLHQPRPTLPQNPTQAGAAAWLACGLPEERPQRQRLRLCYGGGDDAIVRHWRWGRS